MKKCLRIIFIICFSLSFMNLSFAALEIKVKAKVDKAKVKMGEEVLFSVELTGPVNSQLDLPEFGDKIQGLRIVESGLDEPKIEDGKKTLRRWYKLATDLSGSYVLPSIEIKESDTKSTKTSEIFLEVESLYDSTSDSDSSQDALRDIKDVESLSPPLPWVAIVLGLIVLGGGFAGAYFYFNRQKKMKETVIIILPHEEAFKSLRALKNSTLLQDADIKQYHFSLSDIIRLYVEKIFNFPATDLTLQEIKSRLAEAKLMNESLRKDLVEILEKTDYVKFTDYSLPTEVSEELLEKAMKIVEATKPIEPIDVSSASPKNKEKHEKKDEEDVI